MNYTKGQRCSETFIDGYHRRQCMKDAVITRDDKPYCGIHDPEYIKKKNEKSRQKYEGELNLRVAERIAGAGCRKINPDNPKAVAESIGDMYEALKAFDKYLEMTYPENMQQKWHATKLMEKALAKAEGVNNE